MNIQSSNLARVGLAATIIAATLAAHVALAQPQATPPVSPQSPASIAVPVADIHDIRDPTPLNSPWLIPLVVITALVALGSSYTAWVWNRRRFNSSSKRPLDIALARLDKARELMTPLHGREFSIEVSSVVRDYIESRFDLRAAHLTTHEFLHQLPGTVHSSLVEYRALLDDFLQTCDLAKFGGWNLAEVDMEAMQKTAREFIVASAPERKSPPVTPTAPAVNQPTTSISREAYVSLPST